jgi:uncharacterized paraquat-inducible protein A
MCVEVKVSANSRHGKRTYIKNNKYGGKTKKKYYCVKCKVIRYSYPNNLLCEVCKTRIVNYRKYKKEHNI